MSFAEKDITMTEQIVALLDAGPGLGHTEVARRLGCSEAHVRRARALWEARKAAPEVRDMAVDALRTDGGTQMREHLDPATVAAYADAMHEYGGYGSFPPVDAVSDGPDLWLWNGFHRRAAALQAQLATIPVRITRGTHEDAIALACASDNRTPLPRTARDKRRAVEAFLKLPRAGAMAERLIAHLLGVSHGLVGKVRQELRDGVPTVGNGRLVSADGIHIGDQAPPPPEAPGDLDDDEDDDSDWSDELVVASRTSPLPGIEDDEEEGVTAAGETPAGERAPKVSRRDLVPPRPPVDYDEVDEVWLASLPVRSKIAAHLVSGLDRAALRWRRFRESDTWGKLDADVGRMFEELRGEEPDGFLMLLNRFRKTPRPGAWKVCPACEGEGAFLGHKCEARGGCNGRGWRFF